jgi:hypothetical protein
MADQWKARIKEIAGVSVAMVDVTITRTLFMDPEALQQFGGALIECGLGNAKDFASSAQQVSKEMRRFVFTPWSDVENSSLNLSPFSTIVDKF